MKLRNTMLMVLFLCHAFCVGCSSQPDYEGYESRWLAAFSDDDTLKELLDDINRELAERPDDARLLRIRLSLSSHAGDNAAAVKDIYRLAELFPDAPYYQFEKCLVLERMQGAGETAIQCYAAILPLYEKEFATDELKRNAMYITTALLAESPDAESLKENFLRAAGDDAQTLVEKELLRHFDRKTYVQGIMPPESPPVNAPQALPKR